MVARIHSYEPLRLYRYRAFEELDRELEAISKGYLYCSLYHDLNDPMEGLFALDPLVQKSKKAQTIIEAIVSRKSRIGMCAFSEVYDSALMWAHYASQFKGICVGYSLSRLLKNLQDDIRFVRMYYNEKVPTVHRRDKEMEMESLAKMVLSYKKYRWLYEREWRMFATPGKAPYRDMSCVTHVYLGSRMKPPHRERVKNKLLPLGIKVSEMDIRKYSI